MRLLSFNDGTLHEYSYDANGNPTSITNRFASLSYDSLNSLRRIVHSQTDDYWYNSAGLRVKKTEDSGGAWKTTYTLYDGDNILMQEVYTASGRIQVTFNVIVGGKILAQYKRVYPSTDSVVYFYLDNLDSRRVVLDSSGAVVDRYRYSAWGVATQDAGTDDYRSFTGKDYDATGLVYFNARYYDPAVGRFVTEDPARKGTGWYTYCENDPVNRVDLKGLATLIAENNKPTFVVSKGDTLCDIIKKQNPKATNSEILNKVNETTKLNKLKDPNLIFIGQHLLAPESVVPDITVDLFQKMHTNVRDQDIQNPFLFRDKVKSGGVYDFKNQIGTIYESGMYEKYYFNNEIIRGDAPGNIHYGYIGEGTWWHSDNLLYWGAGEAQKAIPGNSDQRWDTAPWYGDDPVDHFYIVTGQNLYAQDRGQKKP